MQMEMRGVNYDLNDVLKDHIEHRLRFALGRFAARIHRLTVRLTDVNGPRGGLDKRCRIAVALVPRGVVMVEGSGDDPFVLITDAAKRVGRAVRRELERRRRFCSLAATSGASSSTKAAWESIRRSSSPGCDPRSRRTTRPRPDRRTRSWQ
jgi:putative sigma-54 modulation protein